MRRTCLTLIAVFASVIAVSPALAAADPGVLTASEYQQLNAAGTKIQQLKTAKTPNWQRIFAACDRMGGTPLMKAERQGCTSKFQEVKTILSTEAAVKNEKTCEKKTGKDAVQCLLPAYVSLDKQADRAVKVDITARKAVAARGFTARCYAVLSDSAKILSTDRRFATIMDQTVGAMRSLNGPKLEKLGPKITSSLDAVVRENGPSEFALCRHL